MMAGDTVRRCFPLCHLFSTALKITCLQNSAGSIRSPLIINFADKEQRKRMQKGHDHITARPPMKNRYLFLFWDIFRELFLFTTLKMDVPSAPQIMVDPACVLEVAECGEDMDLPTDDHLMNLKALTEKLRLETRRPSYLEWKARLETESFRETGSGKGPIDVEPEGKAVTPKGTVVNSQRIQCKLPSGVLKGFGNIDEALSWLRRELVRHCLNSKTNVSFVSSICG